MARQDLWENRDEVDSPAYHAFAITPNDAVELTTAAKAIYIGGEGDITLVTVGGEEVTFTGLLAGTILPVRSKQIKEATTATNLIGLY
jgi:hypothetical protein